MVYATRLEVGTVLVLPKDIDNGGDLKIQIHLKYDSNFHCILYSGSKKIAEETFKPEELLNLINKLYLTYTNHQIRRIL